MEKCQCSLGGEIAKRTNIYSFYEILDFILQMAWILAKMQILGILHRDIKPENILIQKKQTTIYQAQERIYKLADFGYAVFEN